MQHYEVKANFGSLHGEVVLLTYFPNLKKCTVNVFTKEIFYFFHPMDVVLSKRLVAKIHFNILYTL